MRYVLAFVLAVHGAIHFMGFAKAFRLAELPQLKQPVPASLGVVWLIAGLLFLGAAGVLIGAPRWSWVIGAAAVLVSQIAIFTAWSDAKAGTAANVVALVAVVYGFLSYGPTSFRAEYARQVERSAAAERSLAPPTPITEADLARLPAPVQRYLRVTGAVGRPRVTSFRLTFSGRIRSGPADPWMTFTGEQHNFYRPPARLFFLDASRSGVPFEALHLYIGPSATMRVKLASAVQIVDASGPEMDQSETVTLFNDMCVLAPPTLVDPSIVWEDVDAHTARATFTNAGYTVHGELRFDDAGELVDFVSDDRSQSSPDGKSFTKMRWSTPLRDYRSFGPVRIATHGEGRWHAPAGEFAYLEIEVVNVAYNPYPADRE